MGLMYILLRKDTNSSTFTRPRPPPPPPTSPLPSQRMSATSRQLHRSTSGHFPRRELLGTRRLRRLHRHAQANWQRPARRSSAVSAPVSFRFYSQMRATHPNFLSCRRRTVQVRLPACACIWRTPCRPPGATKTDRALAAPTPRRPDVQRRLTTACECRSVGSSPRMFWFTLRSPRQLLTAP